MSMPDSAAVSRVAGVGAGTIGAGLATLFPSQGLAVALTFLLLTAIPPPCHSPGRRKKVANGFWRRTS